MKQNCKNSVYLMNFMKADDCRKYKLKKKKRNNLSYSLSEKNKKNREKNSKKNTLD